MRTQEVGFTKFLKRQSSMPLPPDPDFDLQVIKGLIAKFMNARNVIFKQSTLFRGL